MFPDQDIRQVRKRITYKAKLSKESIMGVFKSLRRRNQGRMSKKLLNYSAISDGSGNTHNDSKDDSHDDMFAATAPLITTSSSLFEGENRTSRVVSPLANASKTKNQKPKMTMEVKRVSLEPIIPLGEVVNEDAWDEISHISGISTRSESSENKKNNIPSEDIREDLDALAAAFEGTPLPVFPAPSKDTPHKNSQVPTTVAPAVVSPEPLDQQSIVHILTGVDGETATNGNQESLQNSSKVSHVFEDDQSSKNFSNTSGELPIYSKPIDQIASVFDAVSETEVESTPVAPSFDGSTSTAFTDNKSPSNHIRNVNKSVETENDAMSVVSFKAVQEKLHAFDSSMRSSVAAMTPDFKKSSPACTNMFSSPADIKANFQDSIDHIKKELSDFYTSSGMAAAAAKAEEQVEIYSQSLFQTKAKDKDQSDQGVVSTKGSF